MIFVVTNTELGWDCVLGVYDSMSLIQKEFTEIYKEELKPGQTILGYLSSIGIVVHPRILQKEETNN